MLDGDALLVLGGSEFISHSSQHNPFFFSLPRVPAEKMNKARLVALRLEMPEISSIGSRFIPFPELGKSKNINQKIG